jgi:hypothetical protein
MTNVVMVKAIAQEKKFAAENYNLVSLSADSRGMFSVV